MSVLLFGQESDYTIKSFIASHPQIFSGQFTDFIPSRASVSLRGVSEVLSFPTVDDDYMIFSAPYIGDYYERSSNYTPHHKFVAHKDFSDIRAFYGSGIAGGSQIGNTDRIVQEAVGNRLYSPLTPIKNKLGQDSKCTSTTNSTNCLTTTSPDNTKILIIDPYSDIVRLLNNDGDTVDKYAMPAGTFAKAIAVTSSNDRYWLLNWESADYMGGNKFTIEARRWDDSSLFIYETMSDEFLSFPQLSPDYTLSQFITSAPSVRSNILGDRELHSFPIIDDSYCLASTPILEEHIFFISSFPIVSDIRVELRSSAPRHIAASQIRQYGEFNKVDQLFDVETDVFLPRSVIFPIRTEDMKHEFPYQDTRIHFYGHAYQEKYQKSIGGKLQDKFFIANKSVSTSRNVEYNQFYTNNKMVTAPHLVATETRLFFGIVRHRGGWPWEDLRYENTDPRHCSSQTFLYEVDVDTRFPKQDTLPKTVSMSGTEAIQANDDIGIVMVDSFFKMGNDDLLYYYFINNTQKANAYKSTHIAIFDFNFNQLSRTRIADTWLEYPPINMSNTSKYLRFKDTPTPWRNLYRPFLTDAFNYPINVADDSIHNPLFSRMPFNGSLKLFKDTIAWSGSQGFRGALDRADGLLSNETNATDVYYIVEYDNNLTILNKLMTIGQQRALLAFSIIENSNFITSKPLIVSDDYQIYIASKPIICLNGPLDYFIRSAPLMIDHYLLASTPIFIEERNSIYSYPSIADRGYVDTLTIITNTSPNEALDGENGVNHHPSGNMGVYPYSARFWQLGNGMRPNNVTGTTWRVSFLRNLEEEDDGSIAYALHKKYTYKSFPYPLQYLADNINGLIFGLARPAEGRNWYGETGDISINTEAYGAITVRSISSTDLQNGNPNYVGTADIGGVIHKYDGVNKKPIKTAYIPGYVKKEGGIPEDPFFQIRYFGNSPKNKKLYVIRASGMRDYFHSGTALAPSTNNQWFVRGGDDQIGIIEVSKTDIYTETSTPYGTPVTTSTTYGRVPSESNIPNKSLTDFTPCYSLIKKTQTIANFSTPMEEQVVQLSGSVYSFDITKAIDYSQYKNTYEMRDILVYDYELNYINRIASINGISEDEVILHLTEKNGTFYIITHAKTGTPFDWATYHARLSVGNPIKSGYEDMHYGYGFRELKIYKVESSIYGRASLVTKLPWAGHSVGDILIQEITNTHIWLNWSGVHKARAGSCLGLGVRLDGGGYVEVPGLIAIYENEELQGGWELLCYKNVSKASEFHFIDLSYSLEPDGQRFLTGKVSEKFPRFGEGILTTLIRVNESTIILEGDDSVYHPEEDWYRPIEIGVDDGEFHKEPIHDSDFYAGGPQPSYSQVIRNRQYTYIASTPILLDNEAFSTVETWFAITSGGDSITLL